MTTVLSPPGARQSLFLPLPESVQKMTSDLLGKQITVRKTTPLIITPKTPGVVADYVYDQGGVGALAICDLALASHAGAALMLLPPSQSVEAVRTGKMTDTILENIREVLNIAASLFIHDLRPHVRLRTVYPLPGDLPEAVAKVSGKPAARLDVELVIPGYGNGKLTFLTA